MLKACLSFEEGFLKNLLYEMARLAVMFGDILDRFFFQDVGKPTSGTG